MKRGRFVLPVGHREVVAEMQFGDDPVTRFAINGVEAAPGCPPLSTQELHEAFKLFAQREGIDTGHWRPETNARRLAELVRRLYGATHCKIRGVPHYRDIRLKKDL